MSAQEEQILQSDANSFLTHNFRIEIGFGLTWYVVFTLSIPGIHLRASLPDISRQRGCRDC